LNGATAKNFNAENYLPIFYRTSMIQHSVIFSIKENIDTPRIKQFFKAAVELTKIPGVINFKSWKQVSKKNAFHYGMSMEFSTQEQYQQ